MRGLLNELEVVIRSQLRSCGAAASPLPLPVVYLVVEVGVGDELEVDVGGVGDEHDDGGEAGEGEGGQLPLELRLSGVEDGRGGEAHHGHQEEPSVHQSRSLEGGRGKGRTIK